MKIFQLILNDNPSADIRYADELYQGINIYFPEYTINQYILSDKQELTKSTIDLINSYDYLFIHNLDNYKNHYIQIYKYITCKKILFITNQNAKTFISKINIEYIQPLLTSCYKIVLNKHINDLVQTISNLYNTNIDNKLIQLDYIYNTDYLITDNQKNKEIIQISNKGLLSKYELFINMFIQNKTYFKDFIWKIYGVEKNIQTLSVDNLYIDKTTNKKSLITNFNENIIDQNKINVYKPVDNIQIKNILYNTYFACCFDNYDFINYTILDIIYCGVIPIFNIDYAKNIKINNKQSIADIINGIYINDNDIQSNTLVKISTYINSINTYKSTVLHNINICNKLYNPQTNIKKIFDNL